MKIQIIALIVIYAMVAVSAVSFIYHFVVSMRSGFLHKYLRRELSKEDIESYKQHTRVSRKYVTLGGILFIIAALLFVLLAMFRSIA